MSLRLPQTLEREGNWIDAVGMPKKNPAIDGDVYLDVHSIRGPFDSQFVKPKPSMENCFHPRHPRLGKGSGWGPRAPWMWIQWMRFLLGLQKVPGGIDGFGWVLDGLFLLRGSRRITKNFKVLLQNCKSLPASSCGTLCFCVFPCVVFWFGMNPNFPISSISQPQGFDSPCHCWHLCAFILGRKPLSAALKPLEFWSFKLKLPQSAKTAASLHQVEKTLRPRPDYTRLYQTTRPFRSLKMSKQITVFSHTWITWKKLDNAPHRSCSAKDCQGMREGEKKLQQIVCRAVLHCFWCCLTGMHHSFRTCDHRRLDCHFSWEGLAPSKQSKSRNQMESGGKPMKDDGSWEVALEVNRLTRRGTFCGCRFWCQ